MTTQTVGERVRAARKIAGLTQLQLANRAHMSLSLVKKVEQGTTPASPAFIAACARALGLGVAHLTSQPYPVSSRDEHKVHSVIPALRREIAAYLLAPGSEIPPRPVDDLAEAVKHASTLRQSASLDQLGTELPPLLAELRAAAHHSRTPIASGSTGCSPRRTPLPARSPTSSAMPTCRRSRPSGSSGRQRGPGISLRWRRRTSTGPES